MKINTGIVINKKKNCLMDGLNRQDTFNICHNNKRIIDVYDHLMARGVSSIALFSDKKKPIPGRAIANTMGSIV
ncbi:hypothetical protein GCM10027284_15900 [Cyclobacterium sediminis]